MAIHIRSKYPRARDHNRMRNSKTVKTLMSNNY